MDSVAELHGDSPSYLKIAIQEASYNTDKFISGCSSNLLTCIVYNIAILGKKPLLFRRIRGHLIKDLSGKWPMVQWREVMFFTSIKPPLNVQTQHRASPMYRISKSDDFG